MTSASDLSRSPGAGQDTTRAMVPRYQPARYPPRSDGGRAELPLDYHDPNGAKTTVALLKIEAKDPMHRLGTLFVNPGGPGDSAQDLALAIAGSRSRSRSCRPSPTCVPCAWS